jgi:hypothetical protein
VFWTSFCHPEYDSEVHICSEGLHLGTSADFTHGCCDGRLGGQCCQRHELEVVTVVKRGCEQIEGGESSFVPLSHANHNLSRIQLLRHGRVKPD